MDIDFRPLEDKSIQTVGFSNNKDLVEHGISFHWWNAERTSVHCHAFYEIFIITKGSALHIINGEESEIQEGTLHLIEPKDRHQIISSPGGCTHMNICMQEEKLEAICTALGITLYDLLNSYSKCTHATCDDLDFFINRGKMISMISHNKKSGIHIIMSELASEAVSLLCNSMVIEQMCYPQWFTQLLKKIHEPENIDCTAADIYRLGGFSASAMIEYFKKYTGKTVNEYLRMLKMDYAKDVLRNTDISLVELSNLLGYSSLSHFSRTFKEITGSTPAAYRKSRAQYNM